jgi:hypothetical protein
MDVTITNAGGRIEIVDLRNDLTNNYDVLKDGLRLFNLGDIVRITFINRRSIEINYNEVELINGSTSIFPVSGVDFLNELNVILGDFDGGGGATELNDLTDVQITSVANGEVLIYDSALSKWVNTSAPGGGDMFKAVYDTDNDGVVDKAETVQIIVRNSTGVTLTKGQIVYLSGATGNRPNAVLSQANAEATSSKTIGWVTANINNNSDGYIGVSGSAHDLDTSAFTAGDALWLSPTVAGGITATMPTQPDHAVFIGYCARSHPTQGRIVFKIQNGYELQELHNILITSVANNDGLFYESSTSLWKNKTIETVLGFTPVTNARTLSGTKSISGGGDLTANRTFELVNDETSPTARKFYSTNGSSVRGWRTIERLDLPTIVSVGSIPYVQNEFISFTLASAIVKVPGSNVIFAAYTTTNTVVTYNTVTSTILSTTTVAGASGLVYVAATGQVWAFGSAASITRFTATTGVSLGANVVLLLTASCRGVYDDSSVTGNIYAYNGSTMNVINHLTYVRLGVSIGGGTGSFELNLVTSGVQSGLLVGTVNLGVFGFNKTTNTLAYGPSTAFSSPTIKYIPTLNKIITVSFTLNSIYVYTPATATSITLSQTIAGIFLPYYVDFDETENFLFVVSGYTGTSAIKLSIFDLTTFVMIKSMLLTSISTNGVSYISIDKTNKVLYVVGVIASGSINKIVYA